MGRITEFLVAPVTKPLSPPVRRGFARSLISQAVAAFNPATQFAPNLPGLWVDPSDYATLFQDSAGTAPVTGVAQLVGLMLDKRLTSNFVSALGLTFTKTQGDGVLSVMGNVVTVTGATTTTLVSIASDIPFTPGFARLKVRADYAGATGVAAWLRGAPVALAANTLTLLTNNLNNSPLDRFDVGTGTVTFNIFEFSYWRSNIFSQATASARPLTNTQGVTKYLTFDGIDDGLSTGPTTFSADMDCFIAVRRNSAANVVLAMPAAGSGGNFFGVVASGDTSIADAGSGSPTYTANGVPVNGGLAGTSRAQLHTALPVASWVVLEVRNLNLSAGWASLTIGNYGGAFNLNGDLGGIILCPAGDATARQKNRQYLGNKVGLTLP